MFLGRPFVYRVLIVTQVQWPPHWEFPAACLGASLSLLGLVLLLPAKPRSYVSPLCCGLIFALGLGASGMTSQRKVSHVLKTDSGR